ncbi:MAG: hypothetical protein PWQ82_820 [Thermosediminibacterales bacterium]|nr:hypothetical protein [Thermosediminibacterales bacterium]MDK2835761.1 hypothetical protein [Thermosediminibacterales bacterium]
MEDLIVAETTLKNNHNLSLVVVKNKKVISTKTGRGVKPLMETLEELGSDLNGASIADKVVGRGSAAVMATGQVSSLYTPVITRWALNFLKQKGVIVKHEKIVPNILNRKKTDLCPVEKLTSGLEEPSQILLKIKEFLATSGI